MQKGGGGNRTLIQVKLKGEPLDFRQLCICISAANLKVDEVYCVSLKNV